MKEAERYHEVFSEVPSDIKMNIMHAALIDLLTERDEEELKREMDTFLLISALPEHELQKIKRTANENHKRIQKLYVDLGEENISDDELELEEESILSNEKKEIDRILAKYATDVFFSQDAGQLMRDLIESKMINPDVDDDIKDKCLNHVFLCMFIVDCLYDQDSFLWKAAPEYFKEMVEEHDGVKYRFFNGR